jgi:hypothetical protein
MSAVHSRSGAVARKFVPTRSGAGMARGSWRVVCFLLVHDQAASKPILSHKPRHMLAVTAHSQGSEFGMDSGVAIGFCAELVNLSDPLGESGVLTLSVGGRTVFPLTVAAS